LPKPFSTQSSGKLFHLAFFVSWVQNNVSRKVIGKRDRNFLNIPKFVKKSLPENQKYLLSSKFSNVEVHFFNSSDRLLSSESANAFTDSPAQSVRELWPIITSKAKIVPSVGPKDLIIFQNRPKGEQRGPCRRPRRPGAHGHHVGYPAVVNI